MSAAGAAAQAAALAEDPRPEGSLDSVGDRLRDERDRAIRGAHGHGVPVATIARMMKMSVQRISQIVAH